MRYIPLIGRMMVAMKNMMRLETTLEQNADFIAKDLEHAESTWVGLAVGVIDGSK